MIARLRTRCGCEKYLDLSVASPPREIALPLKSHVNVAYPEVPPTPSYERRVISLRAWPGPGRPFAENAEVAW